MNNNSNVDDLLNKFKLQDNILKELLLKCTEVRNKRQKYYDRLINNNYCDEKKLKEHGVYRHIVTQYEPITQKYLLPCLKTVLKNDDNAKQCLDYIITKRKRIYKVVFKNIS